MLQTLIIKNLNSFLKNYLNLPFEPLKTNDNISFASEGSFEAINYRRSDLHEVKTIHWFADFYLYIDIKFSKDYSHKMISISVFHGDAFDKRKNQLFRAEWDDYNKDDEVRPQPHWHITRDKANYENFSQLIKSSNESEQSSFELFKMSDAEIFDTKKIHFAMSSNWQNKEHFVHKIDNASKVVTWMEGLLEHIKYELEN